MAGESWRLKQALAHPVRAFQLLAEVGAADWPGRVERTQSFDAFKRALPFRPNTVEQIDIVLIGASMEAVVERIQLDKVVAMLQDFVGFRVALWPEVLKTGDWAKPRRSPDGTRDQVSASQILELVKSLANPRSAVTIGLTDIDLYPPRSFDFVTGVTDAAQRVGIYSFNRYDVSQLSSPMAPTPTYTRKEEVKDLISMLLVKSLCRETMKLCGVQECHMLHCLMNEFPGPAPEDVKELPLSFCCICLRKLQWLTQTDLLDRYARLPSVLSDWCPHETLWILERMPQVGLPTYVSLSSAKHLHCNA